MIKFGKFEFIFGIRNPKLVEMGEKNIKLTNYKIGRNFSQLP